MDEPGNDTPTTVPFWVLEEAVPAMLGAVRIYELRATPAARAVDLDRFKRAIEIIVIAMEAAVPGSLSTD